MCVGVCHAHCRCLFRYQLTGQGLLLVNLTPPLANAIGSGQPHLVLAAYGGGI